jgi:ABC-type dipeptide/oligopeptide/nickel transport system permease subunit
MGRNFNFVSKEKKQDTEQIRRSLTYWQDVWRRLKKNKLSMLGLGIVIIVVLIAIFGPMFRPMTYSQQFARLENLPPKLDLYELEEGKYIFRTEDYNLIEFDDSGEVVTLIREIDRDEVSKVNQYAYGVEYEYDFIEGTSFPLPASVTLDPDIAYSEVWGIGFRDISEVSGDDSVVVAYVHPDSPILDGDLTIGVEPESLVGLVIDQFIFADTDTNPDIIDFYTIKSQIGSTRVVLEMERIVFSTGELKGSLYSLSSLESERIILDYSLKSMDPEDRPAGYEDVEYIFTYKGEEVTELYGTVRNSAFPWGTDALGRDLLTRVMYGTRISLLVALIATLVNFFIGVTYGSVSGLKGGRVDNMMMRIVDIINSIPLVLYVILLMVLLRELVWQVNIFGNNVVLFNGKDGFTTIVIALGSVYWVGMARLVRGQVLGLKEQEYVLAARTIGVSNRKIIFRHLIPNALGPIIVSMAMMIPSAVFTEAFLSFIGIGVSVPQASLGTLANDALGGILRYTYQLIYPSMAIAVTMLGFNFLGDGLRDALDPRLRKG